MNCWYIWVNYSWRLKHKTRTHHIFRPIDSGTCTTWHGVESSFNETLNLNIIGTMSNLNTQWCGVGTHVSDYKFNHTCTVHDTLMVEVETMNNIISVVHSRITLTSYLYCARHFDG
jgi:hypothetical protein